MIICPNSKMFLVCPMKYAAVLVQADGSHSVVPLDDEVYKSPLLSSARMTLYFVLSAVHVHIFLVRRQYCGII